MYKEILWAEKQTLGGMMLDKSNIPKVYDILSCEDFSEGHRALYDTIVGVYAQNGKFDAALISPERRTPEFDKLMIDCVNSVISVSSTPDEAKKIKQYSSAAKAIDIMSDYSTRTIDAGNVDDIIREAVDKLSELSSTQRQTKLRHVREGILNFYQDLKNENSSDERVTSGYKGFDRITGGMWNSDMVVIAARPGVGKSAFAINLILNFLKSYKKVALFSFEMSEKQVIQRFMAMTGSVPLGNILNRAVESNQYTSLARAASMLSESGLYISDQASTISQIKVECRIRGVDVLVVDYLSLTPTENRHTNTYERVSELARGYKYLAQELNIPVIVLAQLNRQTEGRSSNRPTFADLRDSGEIEQAANQIIFLYEHGNLLAVDTAKNRQGETGTVLMEFYKPIMRIVETNVKYEQYSRSEKKGRYKID